MQGSLATTPPLQSQAPTVRRSKPSRWIWVPFIWLFFASTRSPDIWFHGGNVESAMSDLSDLSGSPIDRVLLTVLIILSLYVLGSRAKRTKEILRRNKWLLVLFLYMSLSVLWSNFPDITLRRSMRSVGTLVMVLVVLTEQDPLGAVGALIRRLYVVQIPLSIIAIKYFRTIGVTYDWSGIEEQWVGLSRDKNSLGQVAMCSALLWAWQILQDWPKKNKKKLMLDVFFLALSLWLLGGSKNSHSSTAILGFITSAAVLFGLQFIGKRAARPKRIIIVGTLALALLSPLVYFAFQVFGTTPVQLVLQATGRDLTLTDRTLLWTDLVNNAAKHPVLGVGFGAFWVGSVGYDMYPLPNWSRKTPEWRPGQGHNGYLDTYVDLGVIGVLLLFIVIGIGITGALGDLENRFELGSLRLVLLLGIVMNNMTEASLLKGTHMLWFLFLLVAINVPAATRSKRKVRLRPITSPAPRIPAFNTVSVVRNLSAWGGANFRESASGIALTNCFAAYPAFLP